jgi:hypothetical protein
MVLESLPLNILFLLSVELLMFKFIFVHLQYYPIRRGILGSSVGDSCHFGTDPDPDPDPHIHTFD